MMRKQKYKKSEGRVRAWAQAGFTHIHIACGSAHAKTQGAEHLSRFEGSHITHKHGFPVQAQLRNLTKAWCSDKMEVF
eukprot:1158201-Pelagomonas_calceolata.AAC.4